MPENHTDFTIALEQIVADIQKIEKEGKMSRLDLVPFKLQIISYRIENAKLIEMRKQTAVLEKIVKAIDQP